MTTLSSTKTPGPTKYAGDIRGQKSAEELPWKLPAKIGGPALVVLSKQNILSNFVIEPCSNILNVQQTPAISKFGYRESSELKPFTFQLSTVEYVESLPYCTLLMEVCNACII